MELLQIIFGAIVVYIVVDIYRRLFDFKRSLRVLLFFNDAVNKALDEKGHVSRDEMRAIGKKVLYGKSEKEHALIKADLLKSGIDFRE